eukprot:gene30259-36565_t
MGNFAYNSDSKRFLDAYKVYYSSLLPSSAGDPIDLAPILYALTIFKHLNVKKQLKFVEELEAVQEVGQLRNYNPVYRNAISLMGDSSDRYTRSFEKEHQLKPELVERLLEAAWYGSYYQHTLHFVKRIENLRYNKVFARPFNVYRLKAFGLHGDLGDIKVCSQLTYLEIIALFVAMKQDLQYITHLLYSRDAIDISNSSSTVIDEHGFLMKCVLSVIRDHNQLISSSTADEEQQEAMSTQSVFPRVLRILDEVDACDLERSLNFKLPSSTRFDAVYFTFPYANTNNKEETPSLKPFDSHFVGIGRHSQLIRAFLRSAKDVITPNGEEGWALDKAYEFNYKVWKELGYVPKRTHGLDTFVSKSYGRGDGGQDVAYMVHFSRK